MSNYQIHIKPVTKGYKEHRCDACGNPILKGESFHRVNVLKSNSPATYKAHKSMGCLSMLLEGLG